MTGRTTALAPSGRPAPSIASTAGRTAGARLLRVARLALALLLLVVLAPAPTSAQTRSAAEVFGVRFGVNEPITRIVLDIDAATRFASRVLASPPRLVIELENVRWQVRSHPQGQPVGLAKTVNYGNLDAGRGRLVIDIDRPFRIHHQDRLPPSADAAHHRIVIDLVALDPSPPAAPAPAPAPPTTSAQAPSATQPPAGPAATTEPRRPAATATADAAEPPIAGPPRHRPAPPPAEITTAAAAPEALPTAPAAGPMPEPAPNERATTETDATEAATTGAERAIETAAIDPAAVAQLPLPGTNHHAPVATLDGAETAGDLDGDATGDDVADSDGETILAIAPIQPAPALPARRRIIALDPGHGGADPGTIGINGVLEKEVTLDLANRLRRLIEATGRYDVVLTRDADVFVSLRDRMEQARRTDAALFISIHADSLGDSRLRGASVYTLSDQASDAEAARLANKENRADIIAGTDLSAHDEVVAGILIDLAQRVTNNKSIEFADVLTTELADVTALVRNTRRFAGFVVLKSPDVPSVLLELGYLSNPTDAANLALPEYRDKLARATLRAIDRYFAEVEAAL